MNVAAYALCLALSQEPEVTPPETAPAPNAEGQPAAAPAAPSGPARPKGADEVNRLLAKLPTMKPEERNALLEALAKQYGQAESSPVLPGSDIDLDRYLGLTAAQQV